MEHLTPGALVASFFYFWRSVHMQVRVNGKPCRCPEGETLLALVLRMELNPERVVAEHNRVIIKSADLATVTMKDNDEVELLQFVGGG